MKLSNKVLPTPTSEPAPIKVTYDILTGKSIIISRSSILDTIDHCFFLETPHSLGFQDPYSPCLPPTSQAVLSQSPLPISAHLPDLLVMEWPKAQPLDLLSPLSTHISVMIFLSILWDLYTGDSPKFVSSPNLSPKAMLLIFKSLLVISTWMPNQIFYLY